MIRKILLIREFLLDESTTCMRVFLIVQLMEKRPVCARKEVLSMRLGFSRKTSRSFLCAAVGVFLAVAVSSGASGVSCPTGATCETYTYDVHGRLIEVERVKDVGGTETTAEIVYTYDEAHNREKKKTTIT